MLESWSEDITLLHVVGSQPDENGNQVPMIERRAVQAAKHNISRNEFYQAAQAGIRPAYMLVVHAFEYHEESEIEDDHATYTVVRTYQRNDDEVELYVLKKVGTDNG